MNLGSEVQVLYARVRVYGVEILSIIFDATCCSCLKNSDLSTDSFDNCCTLNQLMDPEDSDSRILQALRIRRKGSRRTKHMCTEVVICERNNPPVYSFAQVCGASWANRHFLIRFMDKEATFSDRKGRGSTSDRALD